MSENEDNYAFVCDGDRRSDPYIRELPDYGFAPVTQAQDLGIGLMVMIGFEDIDTLNDYGPYSTVQALQIAIDKKLADPKFAGNEIVFRYWVPRRDGRKNRRVAMKAVLYMTEGGRGWLLLQKLSPSELQSVKSVSVDSR